MFISLAEQLPKYALSADPPPSYDPEKVLKDFNALTPDQKGAFANGIALAVSSSDTDRAFKKASAAAATSVQEIETLFIVLTAKLVSLGNTENFVETFKIIQKVSICSIMPHAQPFNFNFASRRISATL